MKNLLMFSVCLFLFFFTTSCKKDCDIAELNPACEETVPTNELCQAAFKTWFYNSETETCSEIGYSGCSQKGFETKEDCEACKCN